MKHATESTVALMSMLLSTLLADAALAQKDISGHWTQTNSEQRYGDTGIGNYSGLPLNEAARMRADTWSPERLFMPIHQCEPHPAPYTPVGPAGLRIQAVIDRRTQDTIAWRMAAHWMGERAHDLDGRTGPSAGMGPAYLERVLHRRVERRHALGDDDASQAGVDSP